MQKNWLGYLLAIAMVLAVTACTSTGPRGSESVAKLLGDRYPYRREIEGEELQYVPDARVEALALPALARALPEVRFYKSNLRTSSVDWPDVDIVVAVAGSEVLAVYTPAWYGPADEKFVSILKQAKAATAEEQVAVGGEIARMFAAVTFPSEVRGAHMDGNVFVAQIWFGQMFWRGVIVGFAEGRVASVMLVNPRAAGTQAGR